MPKPYLPRAPALYRIHKGMRYATDQARIHFVFRIYGDSSHKTAMCARSIYTSLDMANPSTWKRRRWDSIDLVKYLLRYTHTHKHTTWSSREETWVHWAEGERTRSIHYIYVREDRWSRERRRRCAQCPPRVAPCEKKVTFLRWTERRICDVYGSIYTLTLASVL